MPSNRVHSDTTMIGSRISHYDIVEKMGQGGMGVVYKALDARLDRPVALKFLSGHSMPSDDDKARFLREAKAAASLSHANVAAVYEIDESDDGQSFIAMEYVEGETLARKMQRGRLSADEAVSIAIQVAEGLSAAHEQDVIHRDIKPSNIMVTRRDGVKILDFGLAKTLDADLTKTGTTLGTAAYMSPEQVRGDDVDHRTDIWSLGVVLYEMLTGQNPFQADYSAASAYSIVHEDPTPVSALRAEVSEELSNLVVRAMEKEVNARYADVDALVSALRDVQGPSAAPSGDEDTGPSVVVLPFVNMSSDSDQEYFCDGIADEIINSLTRVEGLRVVARTSAFSFKGRNVDVREIGRELGARVVLEGSVRKAANRLRITVQLVDVATGYQLWSERYDRVLEDIFAIQDAIALAVVGTLKVKLSVVEKERIEQAPTVSMEAYDAYHLGNHYMWRLFDLPAARRYFERATELDPRFARAYAGLADVHLVMAGGGQSTMPSREAVPKARSALKTAISLDPHLGRAYGSLGLVYTWFEWKWDEAEAVLREGVEVDPRSPLAWADYAHFLTVVGRHDDAIESIQHSLELDPLSIYSNENAGSHLYYAGDLDGASKYFRKTLDLAPTMAWAVADLAKVLLRKDAVHEAVAELESVADAIEQSDYASAIYGYALARAGRRAEAANVAAFLSGQSAKGLASKTTEGLVRLGLGDEEAALACIEEALKERPAGGTLTAYLGVEPLFDPLRGKPRFQRILKRMRLGVPPEEHIA